jgi:hypothetical protein
MQAPRLDARGPADTSQSGYQIQLVPPGPLALFGRLESQASLENRWREQARERVPMENIFFPEEEPVSRQAYAGRAWPTMRSVAEPTYVCYGRLWFEDKNIERYGWDLGFIQPVLSAATFYADLITCPYRWGREPCRCSECSAGYCLPGSPVPYLLYPIGPSLTGSVAEAGAILALVAIFP